MIGGGIGFRQREQTGTKAEWRRKRKEDSFLKKKYRKVAE